MSDKAIEIAVNIWNAGVGVLWMVCIAVVFFMCRWRPAKKEDVQRTVLQDEDFIDL
jgi:hypothetical protein